MRLLTALSVCLALLSTSACTLEHADSGAVEASYDVPFTSRQWTITDHDASLCVMNSGRNGLELARDAEGVWVRGTRRTEPGNVTEVRINGHRYQTTDDHFNHSDTAAMLADFQTGKRAYLEWSNVRVGTRARVIPTEINNADFAELYDTCTKDAGTTGARKAR